MSVMRALVVVSLLIASVSQAEKGPSVALGGVSGKNPEVTAGAIQTMMTTDLINDLSRACEGTFVETERRNILKEEIERSNTKAFDSATALKRGQLIQPDIVIVGSIGGDGAQLTYTFEATDSLSGEVVATESGTVSTNDVLHVTGPISHRLVEKLCKRSAGYALSGVMDEGTINGKICGKTDKPFTATSPEVAGSWTFTPNSESAGSFSYTAKNIGGVPGSGKGTYTIVKGANGGATLKLSGTGMVHSPMGNFSAAITESIRLTPLKTCGRVGNN